MNKVHPELITLLAVKIFKSNITASDEYINKPVKPAGAIINVGQNTAFNLEKKNIRIRLNIGLEATNSKEELIGVKGDYVIEFHLHVDNLEEFITEDGEKKLISGTLGGALSGIVYSTARGIIYERTAATPFEGVILPVIDPNLLLQKDAAV